MAINFTLIFGIIISLLTGTAAAVTLFITFSRKWQHTLKKGETIVKKGVTLHYKYQIGYMLSIVCQRGIVGENKIFDVRNDTISYEYLYKGKNQILTASIGENPDTIVVTIEKT